MLGSVGPSEVTLTRQWEQYVWSPGENSELQIGRSTAYRQCFTLGSEQDHPVGVYEGRGDQITLQQTPKGVQICSLMPESRLAKVRPLARVRNHWCLGGVDCLMGSGHSGPLLDFWGLADFWRPV